MDETSLFWKQMPERSFINKEAKSMPGFKVCVSTLCDVRTTTKCLTTHFSELIPVVTRRMLFVVCFPGVRTHFGCIFTAQLRALLASSFSRFLDHTQRRATLARNPLDEWSIRRRDLYLTTHDTHNRQTSMPPVGFEPTISAGERPKTYVLDRTVTGTGKRRMSVF